VVDKALTRRVVSREILDVRIAEALIGVVAVIQEVS
jgi:hypothetical protein